jgi:DNA-binding Lrp family transcriptional regulator
MVSACTLIRTERGRFDEVASRIKQIPEVKKSFPVFGRYDVVADLETKDHNRLNDVVFKLSRMGGVVFTETLIELETEGD